MTEHWLRTVALRAGLPEAEELDMPSSTPLEQAWRRAMETLKRSEDDLVALVADHFMTTRADFTDPSPAAIRLIPEKVVRVYHVFPLRENDREIYVATADPTDEEVGQALRYASGRTPVFRIAPPWLVQEAIDRAYAGQGPVRSLMSRVTPASEPEPEVRVEPARPSAGPPPSPMDRALSAITFPAAEPMELPATDPAVPGVGPGGEAGTVDGIDQAADAAAAAEPAGAAPPRATPSVAPQAPARGQPGPARPPAEGEDQAEARLASRVLQDAIRSGATRVILEASEGGNGVVRFRVDGVDRRHMSLSVPALNGVIGKLAQMAQATRGPDGVTGAARVKTGERSFAFHISVGQMGGASRAFLRIQDSDWRPGLAELGVTDRELASLREILQGRTGLVLVAGPEGSGRTTLGRAVLRELVTAGRRPAVIEDRAVGTEMNGVLHTHTSAGAAMVRAIDALSRGRDSVLLDEARDAATLAAAVRCAREHLVVALVDAPDTASALRNGADSASDARGFAEVIRGAVALRQLRRLCPACAAPAATLDVAEAARAEAYGVRPARTAVGCPRCGDTGYSGSLPVVAVLPVEDRLRSILARGASIQDLRRTGRSGGYRPLLQVGLARAAAGETTLAEVERVISGASATPAMERARPLVLLVDDDIETRTIARAVLEKAGYRVDEAMDGEQALERLVTGEDCALVVLDLFMPGMSGHDVLRRIKSDILTAGVHVVVLTGSDNPEDERRAMAEGAEDYVRKPLDPTRFLARVAAALHRKEALLEAAR